MLACAVVWFMGGNHLRVSRMCTAWSSIQAILVSGFPVLEEFEQVNDVYDGNLFLHALPSVVGFEGSFFRLADNLLPWDITCTSWVIHTDLRVGNVAT